MTMPRPTVSLLRLGMLFPMAIMRSGHGWSCNNGVLVAASVFGGTPSFSSSALRKVHLGEARTRTNLQTDRVGSSEASPTSSPRKVYKVVQVHVIHRHGDRTPITPLKNETFWASALPHPAVLDKVADGTVLIRDESKSANNHAAGGRGPFGKLTQMGLFQMVELGNRLREELHSDEVDDHHVDEEGHHHINKGRLFHPEYPLDANRIKVVSTDFPRTIHSVQGLLVGLLPDGIQQKDKPIEIDVRHTNIMIPDPQPRQTEEQEQLETVLAARPHLKEKEQEMKELAIRTTDALRDLLGEGAYEVSYGVGEEKGENSEQQSTTPLSWAQLSEITKCLQIRELLPPSISDEDQEAISSHAAWRWFENLRHPRLAYLAMSKMASRIFHSMHRRKGHHREAATEEEEEHPLHIYSAHDSTLIGLLSFFQLEQPTEWPEYGSYLKLELLEVRTILERENEQEPMESETEYYVRFSLNGQVLRSFLATEDSGEPATMIRLDDFSRMLNSAENRAQQV